jgi:hypothetical protein
LHDSLVRAADNWQPFAKEGFKSAKKLLFMQDETPTTPLNLVEDDFQSNNFSPNDEGYPKPLHIFEHHGIKKKINVNSQDEDMEEDED